MNIGLLTGALMLYQAVLTLLVVVALLIFGKAQVSAGLVLLTLSTLLAPAGWGVGLLLSGFPEILRRAAPAPVAVTVAPPGTAA